MKALLPAGLTRRVPLLPEKRFLIGASLRTPDWRAIRTNPPPTSVAADWLDTGATNAVFFYRLRAAR